MSMQWDSRLFGHLGISIENIALLITFMEKCFVESGLDLRFLK